jgi:hypothetical protein
MPPIWIGTRIDFWDLFFICSSTILEFDMLTAAAPQRKSADRLAYDHYLRSGERLTTAEWCDRFESKFNPNHDELGRFTFAQGGGMAARSGQAVHAGTRRTNPLIMRHATAPPALDSLSAAEEAHGGPGTISSGIGDNGGVSYGSYQLSANKGTAAEFVGSPEARKWADELQGLKPGTEAFNKQWRAIAASDPAGFQAAQKAFVDRTLYDHAARLIGQSRNGDISGASPAVKAVVYSTAVQHGPTGAASIVSRSIAETDRALKRSDQNWQETLISKIYDHRIARVMAISNAALSHGDKQTARLYYNSGTIRLPRERNKALTMLRGG